MNTAPAVDPYPVARSLATKTELRNAAVEIVDEYLQERARETEDALTHEARTSLLERLLARCPGFSTRDYRTALTAAFAGRIRLAPTGGPELGNEASEPLPEPLARRGARRPRARR